MSERVLGELMGLQSRALVTEPALIQLLEEVAGYLATSTFDDQYVTELYDSITAAFHDFVGSQMLSIEPSHGLMRGAFYIARKHGLALLDALPVTLAAYRQNELLIANERLYRRVASIAQERPPLTVTFAG